MDYDIAIIGAGITGACIARELARYDLKVCLLEKNISVAMKTTKANSGIIHGGYAAKNGTFKAKFNVMSKPLFKQVCNELNINYNQIGSFVVALDDEGIDKLFKIRENGLKNGITDIEIIEDREKILKMEPNLNPEVSGVLYCSSAGIISPYKFCIALVENAIINNVHFMPESEVIGIKKQDKFTIHLRSNKEIVSNIVVNAAGLYADEISSMLGLNYFKITPRKGEYVLFDKNSLVINHILFPVPTHISKGIVVSPTVSNNFFVGPNATNIEDKEDVSCTYEGLKEIIEGGRNLIPNIPLRDAIAIFAGLRAVSNNNDFIIEMTEIDGFINVAGIQSPGLSSCLGIAKYVVEIIGNSSLELKEKSNFIPTLKQITKFAYLTPEQKDQLIKEDKNYGKIVCRCETITEAEIRAVINRPLPARTLDDIKFRTRAGMGRCQGGFCTPRILKILCEELGKKPEEITKKGKGSELVIGNTKSLREEQL
ncbi:MAG: NAD(P)/FAD-dependent oxidoreductase [Candidatus Helarchaeota archaeon]